MGELDRARLYVDFNELVEDNLVLLSKQDTKCDSDGNLVSLEDGGEVFIYMDDGQNDEGKNIFLIADGNIEVNNQNDDWTSVCKWLCRIDKKGIRAYTPS